MGPLSPEAEPSASPEAEVSSWHKTLRCGLVRHVSATATTAPQSLPEHSVPNRGAPQMRDTWLVPKGLYGNSELDDDGDGGDDGDDAEHDGELADVTTDGGNHRETKQDHQDHQEKTKHVHRETKQDHPKQ